MTTTLQIEQRLAALSGAKFQRLCDAYLRKRGIESYVSIGLVLGREKTRPGTPDSLAGNSGGHTFVEATTQGKRLGAKLLADLSKCLDPVQTGVAIERIRRAMLFFTGHLDAEEIERLYAVARARGVELMPLGPHELADELRYRFASLAKEYLDLTIDSGQVLDPDAFVRMQSSAIVQTNLDAPFVGRENELSTLAGFLSDDVRRPIVLLRGQGGVGKTRLALEGARRARVAVSPCTILCVRSRGVDAAEDLRSALEQPGRYVILLDDGNRLANLSGIIDVALEPRGDRDVRVLLTCRDYVATSVERLLRERGEFATLTVGALTDDVLRQILIGAFGIQNDWYQRRILEIAAGNARLAVMAARIALQSGDPRALHDATDVYVRYFSPLERECPLMGRTEVLRALACVALVGHLRLSQGDVTHAIGRLHGLSTEKFRSVLEELDDVELVDLFENQVVRVADQTLAAYVLYVALFDRRLLSLTEVLLELYPLARSDLIEALQSVVRAFRRPDLLQQLEAAVNVVWDLAASQWPRELFAAFMLTFAQVRPAEALERTVAWLQGTPGEPAPSRPIDVKISHQENISDPPTLLLGGFRDNEALRTIGIRAIIAEGRRRPSRVPALLRLLWERYGFCRDTNWDDLGPEKALLNVVWQEAEVDECVAAPMFIALARCTLQTEHNDVSEGRGRSIVLTRFQLPLTDAVRSLRHWIWRRLMLLLAAVPLQEHVLELIREYTFGGPRMNEKRIVAGDLEVMEGSLLEGLDRESFRDLGIVRCMRRLRERLGLGLPPFYAPFLSSPRARLADLLLRDPTESRTLGWRAAGAKRACRLTSYGECLGPEQLPKLAEEVEALLAAHSDHEAWQIREGITILLSAAARTQPAATIELVGAWLERGNPLDLPPAPLLHALNLATGSTTTWQLVNSASPNRAPWILAWLQLLRLEEWTAEHSTLAARLLASASQRELIISRDLLERVCAVDPVVGENLFRQLLNRLPTEPRLARALSVAMYDYDFLESSLARVLLSTPALFGELYLILDAAESHTDPHASVLSALLSADPTFGIRWLDHTLNRINRPSFDDNREYTTLWLREDWNRVLGSLARAILCDDRGTVFGESFIIPLLRISGRGEEAALVASRQDALLTALIRETVHREDQRRRLFYAIASLPESRRRALIAEYLKLNPAADDFAALTLEPSMFGWRGSEVPLLEQRRAFHESLLALCVGPPLLPHRVQIEERLRHFDTEIADARRRDFIEQRPGG